MSHKQQGFTLIELMVAVAIIAILTSIAIPSYQQYVIRSNRADMQAQMLTIASALERYRSQQFNYKSATLVKSSIYGSAVTPAVYPKSGTALYQIELTIKDNDSAWELKATPTGKVQANDGVMKLDNLGKNCWAKGATDCTLGDANQAWSTK